MGSFNLPAGVNCTDFFMTPAELADAKELGRSMAAQAMSCNPEARERVERKFGIAYCKARYPEVYGERK